MQTVCTGGLTAIGGQVAGLPDPAVSGTGATGCPDGSYSVNDGTQKYCDAW